MNYFSLRYCCLQDFFKIFGVRDFLPSNEVLHWMATHVCGPHDLRVFCSSVVFLICGFDVPQLNMVSYRQHIFNYMQFLSGTLVKLLPDQSLCNLFVFPKVKEFPVSNTHKCMSLQTRLPVYIAHTPAGTSVKNMAHFAQV